MLQSPQGDSNAPRPPQGDSGSARLYGLADALGLLLSFLTTRQNNATKAAQDAFIADFVRNLPKNAQQARDSDLTKDLLAYLREVVDRYLDGRQFNPAAAATAAQGLYECLDALKSLSQWLDDEVRQEGKGIRMGIERRRRRVQITALDSRVVPADHLDIINHASYELMVVSRKAILALEQALDLRHPAREVLGIGKHVYPPIVTDGMPVIAFPPRHAMDMYAHLRYCQDRILELSEAMDRKVRLLERAAQKSRRGISSADIVATLLSILEYVDRLNRTCDSLRAVINDVSQ